MRFLSFLSFMLWTHLAFAKEPSWPYCEETIELLQFDQSSALGFSGADMLKMARSVSALTIAYGYNNLQTAASLSVSAQEAPSVRFVRSKAVYPSEGYDIGVICQDRLELGVTIELISQDGVFRDSWPSVLRAQTPFLVGAAPIRFSTYLSADAFKGTFYRDALIAEEGLMFSGAFDNNRFMAHLKHIDEVCNDGACMASYVLDASMESISY